MIVSLPTYNQIERKRRELGESSLDPVEKFIWEHEPAMPEAEEQFRKELLDALKYERTESLEKEIDRLNDVIRELKGDHG